LSQEELKDEGNEQDKDINTDDEKMLENVKAMIYEVDAFVDGE
jgi:hypothetical protein